MGSTDSKLTSYYSEIDVIRCFGIALVVLGHSFPDNSSINGIQIQGWRFVFNVIYSFHMPLFFALSGFVYSNIYKTRDDKIRHIKKRALRLLVPYFMWAIIFIPFKLLLSNYANAAFYWNDLWKLLIGKNPYSGLWFLYALFFVDFLCTVLVFPSEKRNVKLFISFLMLLFAKHVKIEEPVRWLFSYSFYFLLGYEIKIRYDFCKDFFSKRYSICFSAACILVLTFFVDFQNVFHGLSSILTSCSGIILMFGLGILLKNKTKLQELGKYGMDIYILSGAFLVLLRIVLYTKMHLNYNLYVMLATIVSYFLPVLVSKYCIRRIRLLSFILLGNY